MNGEIIFIPIQKIEGLSLRDLQDFLRCLKYMDTDEKILKTIYERHIERFTKLAHTPK